MNIAIDCWPLRERLQGGTSLYARNLVTALSRLDDTNSYTIYQPSGSPEPLGVGNGNFAIKMMPASPGPYFVSVYKDLQKEKPDVLLSGIFSVAPRRVKLVMVIYTLSHFVYARYLPIGSRLVWQIATSLGFRRASRVIVLSESAKKDLHNVFGDSTKAHVIPLGCDGETFKPRSADETRAVRERYGIGAPYVLYVGVIEPRKNLGTLVRAMAQLHRDGRIAHRLVVAGREGWRYQSILREARRLARGDALVFPGYVPYPDYPTLLAGAEVFVYPSFHEGFGLPVLEAMSCGVPVITANTSCFPELVGEAGITVRPDSASDLAQAIYRVVSDVPLRRRMAEAGVRRSRQFTWEQTARQTLRVLQEVGGRKQVV